MNDRVVLTPGHANVNSMDERVAFPLEDVRSIDRGGLLGGKLRVGLARVGEIQLDGGDRPEAPEGLFGQIVASRGT